jgi:Lrp/AsnC family transcriptional regulator, leucine-responsive regulatory protein
VASEERTGPQAAGAPARVHAIDQVDAALIAALQESARDSFASIASRVNLSATSVAERVRRLEEDGVITGYRAEIKASSVGWPVTAFLLIQPNGPDARFAAHARTRSEILECHRVTGHVSFLARAVVRDVAHLEALIDDLAQSSQIITLVVLSSPVERRAVPVVPNRA